MRRPNGALRHGWWALGYNFAIQHEPLRPRLRDVFYGLWLSSFIGGIAFVFLVWPTLSQFVRGELTEIEMARAMLGPSVWTSFVVVLFQLFWVVRLVIVRGSGDFALDLGLEFKAVDFGWGLLGWVAIFVGGLGLERFVVPFVAPGGNDPEPFNRLAAYTEIPLTLKFIMLLTIGFMVPFAEEMLFRGVLLKTIGRWLGPIAGIVISSVIFGWLHAGSWTARDIAYVMWATWAGLVFGLLRVGTDRLGAGIIAHVMQNSLVVSLTIISA